MPSVSPLSFPITSTDNAGGYCDRENWSVTQIPAPPAHLSGALVKTRGTAAQQGYLLPASLGPGARLQALQPAAWFSLDVLQCCDTAFSKSLLRGDKILGSG